MSFCCFSILFSNHLDSAIAHEAAAWDAIKPAGYTIQLMKEEISVIYKTLTDAKEKTKWLDKVRNAANDKAKVEAAMALLGYP